MTMTMKLKMQFTLTSEDRLISFLIYAIPIGLLQMVTTVNVLHRVVIALIQLNTSSFTQLKMQMVFGKLHCNVHSVVVGMMVLSISMIFMLKMVIEQLQIEDPAKIINSLLQLCTL